MTQHMFVLLLEFSDPQQFVFICCQFGDYLNLQYLYITHF